MFCVSFHFLLHLTVVFLLCSGIKQLRIVVLSRLGDRFNMSPEISVLFTHLHFNFQFYLFPILYESISGLGCKIKSR
ncbi:hypothetical protein BJ165DRAFT_1447720 [Panaeolus papilionaceus]|nr:hypothetical protein BJ165DRAFT_1447720 [Panaeolus papilionaceus]